MKRSLGTLMISAFIIAGFADLSWATRTVFYAGKLESVFYTGKILDCQVDKSITIKTTNGKKRTFKITESTVLGKECNIPGKSIWLEAIEDVARYVSELPEGVSLKQLEKEIKAICYQTLKYLMDNSRGAPIFECQDIYITWRRNFVSGKYNASSNKILFKEVKRYFYLWKDWCQIGDLPTYPDEYKLK